MPYLKHAADVGDQAPAVVLGHAVEVAAAGLAQPHHRALHRARQLEEGGAQLGHAPRLGLHLLLHQPRELVDDAPGVAEVELQTEVREDFTITEKAPARPVYDCEIFAKVR